MKKIFTLLLITLSFLWISYNANAQCNYTLQMDDSFGDGWNGNQLNVIIGGTATTFELTSSPGDTQQDVLLVNTGDTIILDYLGGGSYNGEVSFTLLDADGNVVYASGTNPVVGIHDTTITTCPTCPKPSSLTATDIFSDKVTLGWIEIASATSWQIEVMPTNDTLGTGTQTMVGSNSYTKTGLTATTSYDYYVRSVCGAGDSSSWTGPYTFTTIESCPAPINFEAMNLSNNSLDLTWFDNGSGSYWEVEYDTANFMLGSGVYSFNTNDTIQLTGLATKTAYDFYARAICGVGDTSVWSSVYTTATNPDTIAAIPYTNDLETQLFSNFIGEQAGADAAVFISAAAANGSNFGVEMTGATSSNWTGGSSSATDTNAWVDNNSHISSLNMVVNATAVTTCQLDFDLKQTYSYGVNYSWFRVLVNGVQVGNSINPVTANGDAFEAISMDLSAYAGTVFSLSLQHSGKYDNGNGNGTPGGDNAYVDNIQLTAPSCPFPSNLSALTITDSSANITWTEVGTATSWIFEWDTVGHTFGTGTIITTTAIPQMITGLQSSTTYDVYVRADCGGQVSSIVGPFEFTTSCAIATAPYTQEFNTATLPDCWTEGGANVWEYGSSATTPSGFAAYGAGSVTDYSANGNGTFIGIDGSDNSNGNVSTLTSLQIDVSGLTAPQLSYAIFSNNVDDAALNKLIVEFYDGANWNLLDSIQENLGTAWVNFTFDLSSYTISGPVQIRFTITGDDSMGGSTYSNDILIDDVIFEETPSCLKPVSLSVSNTTETTADFSWTEANAATSWLVQWDTTGFVLGTGNDTLINTNSTFSNTNLVGSTTYDFYVKAVCGAGDSSVWVGPFSFTTTCLLEVLPYAENFDGMEPNLPSCWETNNVAEVTTDSSCTGSNNASLQLYGVAGVYAYSPVFDLSNETAVNISYLYRRGDNTNCGNTPEAADSVKVGYWNGTAWANLAMYGGTDAPTVFTEESFYLTTGLNSEFRLRFEIISGSGSGFDNYNFDDLMITRPESIDLSANDIFVAEACSLTNAEEIILAVGNVGLNDTSNFVVSYQVNGGTVVSETITTTLNAGDELLHTFATTADLSAAAIYEIKAWVSLANDAVAVNDTITLTIENQIPVVTLGNDTSICNGTTITLSAGTFSLYNWQDNSNSSFITASNSGTYSVTVTDQFGCTATDEVLVSLLGSPVIDLGADQTLCIDDSTTLSVATGMTYLWSDGSTNNSLIITAGVGVDSLVAITVTNSNMCSSTDNVVLSFINNMTVDLGVDIEACIGDTVVLTAASPSLTFVWSTGAATQTIEVSTNGTYMVTATMCGGASDTIIVNFNTVPTVDLGADQTACWNDTVMVSAGGTNYTYQWSNGDTTMEAGLTSKCNYTIDMFDSFGDGWNGGELAIVTNSDSSLFTLSGGSSGVSYFELVVGESADVYYTAGSFASEVSYDILSNGTVLFSDGSVNTAQEGLVYTLTCGPFEVIVVDTTSAAMCAVSDIININFDEPIIPLKKDTTICVGHSIVLDAGVHSAVVWSTGATTQTISVNVGGAYVVDVTDASGCMKTDSITVIIDSVATFSLGNNTTICAGTTISLDANNFASYLWSNGSTTQSIAVEAGTFNVSVTNSNSCVGVSDDITINSDLVVVNTTITDATCGNSDGVATVVATAGAIPYTYLWSNNTTATTITGLNAGIYNVVATDSLGCSTTATVNVTNSNGPTAVLTNTSVLCFGTATGTATASVSGGVSPYSYVWENGQTTMTTTGVAAGSVMVTVTDGNGCLGYGATTIVSPAVLTSAAGTINIACNGGLTGAVNINTVTGGTTPYTYLWSNGNTTNAVANMPVGTIAYTITDANNCSTVETFMLTQPSAIVVALTVTDACFGDSNGTVHAGVVGGTMPYSYMWSNGATIDNITGAASAYTITVTDNAGCTAESSTAINQAVATLEVATTSTNATCGNFDGTANAIASGGTAPYTYAWSNNQVGANAISLEAGLYSVTVSDASGCTAMASVIVTNSDGPVVLASISDVSCNGLNDGGITLTVGGGNTPYIYLWSEGSTAASINAVPNTYSVTVTDATSCIAVKDGLEITEPTALNVATTSTAETSTGSDGTITVVAGGGTAPYSYAWSNGQTTDVLTAVGGTYTVTVTDDNGCTTLATDSMAAYEIPIGLAAITTAEVFEIFPNPNNGTFVVKLQGVDTEVLTISVMNTIGQTVFETRVANNGNSKYPLALTNMESGVYFITIKGADFISTERFVIK